jgi:hypothetical protein
MQDLDSPHLSEAKRSCSLVAPVHLHASVKTSTLKEQLARLGRNTTNDERLFHIFIFIIIIINILLGYIHYGGICSDNSYCHLYCALFTLSPLSLPLSILPTPLKAIARGFLVLFHIGIRSPSIISHCLNLLPSSSPIHTLPIFQS